MNDVCDDVGIDRCRSVLTSTYDTEYEQSVEGGVIRTQGHIWCRSTGRILQRLHGHGENSTTVRMSDTRRKILMSLPPRKIKKFHEIIPPTDWSEKF